MFVFSCNLERKSPGSFLALDNESITLGESSFSLESTVRLKFGNPLRDEFVTGIECYLVDGSMLCVQDWKMNENNIQLTMPSGVDVVLRKRNVQAIKTRKQPAALAASWFAMSQQESIGRCHNFAARWGIRNFGGADQRSG